MEEHDERTSLVRSTNNTNGVRHPSQNNGYTVNGHDQGRPVRPTTASSRTASGLDDFARRDPQTFLTQVQRSLAPFQTWAAKILHEGEGSSIAVVNWVQSARVARTFMMIINVILAVLAFILMGVEMVETALREPILAYLIPESETVLFAAGLMIVIGAFGFAVAYNLLVEGDTVTTGSGTADERDNDDGHRGGSSGNGHGPGPRSPAPRPGPAMERDDPRLALQQKSPPRLVLTTASTYLLVSKVFLLIVVLFILGLSAARRSSHLSHMDREVNAAWTDAYRHRTKLISDFELRHHCCGFQSIKDRPFPADETSTDPATQACRLNPGYGFQVACKPELARGFERWQKGILDLLLVQVTMLVPLLLLCMMLAAIGVSKRPDRRQTRRHGTTPFDDREAEAQAFAHAPMEGEGPGYLQAAHHGRPLLEGVTEHNEDTPLLVDFAHTSEDHVQDRATVQPTLL